MITLVNPNSSTAATDAMLDIARRVAGPTVEIAGITLPDGPETITTPAALDRAAGHVAALAPQLFGWGGVVIAGFGDPGLAALRAAGVAPITGLAEAGLAEAAAGGRQFAVVTTTPELVGRIGATAKEAGLAGYAGTWVTPDDPLPLMADAPRLAEVLLAACHRAIADCNVGARGPLEAIVIGGGPLATAARAIASRCPVPLVEPVSAAIRRLLAASPAPSSVGNCS